MTQAQDMEFLDPSRYAASAKSTGGGGFNHEDEVAAYYLAQLLAGSISFGTPCGIITEIKFQTRVDGWLLDDLLLTFAGTDGARRCAFSIKSNAQFAADHAAPTDFVHDCWEQFLKGAPMDPARDLLALAVSGTPSDVLDDFHTLRGLAEASELGSFEGRLGVKGFADDGKRRMAASFGCPSDLAARFPGELSSNAASIIARVMVIDFDFPSASSRSRRDALQLCALSLKTPSPDAAAHLWAELCATARDYRPRAGTLNLPGLVMRLRSRHDLAGYPYHRDEWKKLERYTDSHLSVASRWTLAGRLSLLRLSQRKKLDEAVQGVTESDPMPAVAVLVGRSGDGKSVIARQWLAAGSPQLWIDARLFECLSGQNPTAVLEERLKLQHPISKLLQSAAGNRPRLVLDGIGRLFDEPSLNAAAGVARDAAASNWEVVATCQEDDYDRVAKVFVSVGLRIAVIQVDPLTDAELREVSAAEPRLRPLICKDDIRRVLARPKYLDIVLQGAVANEASSFSESDQWTGEAHVAEWCWRRVVEGLPPRTTRSAAAKQMASRQADTVRDSISETDLDAAHLAAIDNLIADGVCRKLGERLVFDHDLLGDWGRQRVLLAQPSVAAFIKSDSRGTSPQWLRALRLWALDVLERQGDQTKWIGAVRELAAAGEAAASDRVLEAVALSAGAAKHLEQVWSELIGEGELLRRLLERFLRSATVPNPRAMQVIAKLKEGAGDDLKTWAATEYRIPQITYWPALLVILHNHRNDVARLAPGEAGRVAQLWLLYTTPNFPFRREAAEIGLTTAQHVHQVLEDRQSRRHLSDGLDEWSLCNEAEPHVYVAALIAAPILPNEVTAFALQAAARGADSQVHKPVEPDVVYANPWPDGPSGRISEKFRDAALSIETFLPLVAAAPDVAKEVLLAVLIDPPVLLKHPGMLGLGYAEDRDLSIEQVFNWSPPFFSRGPFLAFLNTTPNLAIDAIIRLVNFATERWVDREARDVHQLRGSAGPPRPVRFAMLDDENIVEWHGDPDVYSWYLGDPRAPGPVTCALMALEKWLYDRLDNGDNIAKELDQIKNGSRSVALAGLLSAVARYQPNLLKSQLAFLIAIPEFLYWEAGPKHNILSTATLAWRMGPIREPHLLEQAQSWYAMPHRKTNLFVLAQFLFLNDADVRKLQSDRVPRWKKKLEEQLHPEQAEAVAACVRSFDINRWKEIELPDGRKAWQQQQTAEEAKESEQALEEANHALRVINFPYRCRELLSRPNLMDSKELDQFWADLQRVSQDIDTPNASPEESGSLNDLPIDKRLEIDGAKVMHRRVLDGTMGGIAVLLLRYRAYLDANRSRHAWLLWQLRRIPKLRLPKSDMDSFHPDDTSNERWECFFAEVAVDFLRRKPDSIVWRFHAAMLVTGFHHSPVRHLFAAAYAHRAQLDGVFEELCHLLLIWSAVRWHAEHARNGWQINVDVQSEWKRIVDDFLMGRLAGVLPSFGDLAAAPRELPDKPAPPERFRRGLDLPLIAAAFHNIMQPNEAHDEDERVRWLLFWTEFLVWRLMPAIRKADEAEPIDTGDDHDDDQRWPHNKLPYPSDRWLLDRIAGLLLQLRPADSHQRLWQPVIELVPALQPWSEHFLTSLFLTALRIEPSPPTFSLLWTAMLKYASSSPRWSKASDDAWAHLLGFDHLLHDCWETRHAPLLLHAQSYLEWFARTKMRSGWTMRELFGLLKTPAAEEIRLGFLPIFADAIKRDSGLLRRDSISESTAKFLDFCLHHHQSTLMGNSDLFAAFTQIIGVLVAMQEPLACEIQDRLRRH
jgi:hypothetical protein